MRNGERGECVTYLVYHSTEVCAKYLTDPATHLSRRFQFNTVSTKIEYIVQSCCLVLKNNLNGYKVIYLWMVRLLQLWFVAIYVVDPSSHEIPIPNSEDILCTEDKQSNAFMFIEKTSDYRNSSHLQNAVESVLHCTDDTDKLSTPIAQTADSLFLCTVYAWNILNTWCHSVTIVYQVSSVSFSLNPNSFSGYDDRKLAC